MSVNIYKHFYTRINNISNNIIAGSIVTFPFSLKVHTMFWYLPTIYRCNIKYVIIYLASVMLEVDPTPIILSMVNTRPRK